MCSLFIFECLFFSLEGLVSNKPFSLELFLRLSHPTSGHELELISKLAIKISARHMEKRSNTYRPIQCVWASTVQSTPNQRPHIKMVAPPSESVLGSPAAIVGVKPAVKEETYKATSTTRRRPSSMQGSSHPFGISSVFSRSTRTCPPPELKAASRQSKAEYDKSKDRTIGLAPIRLKSPPHAAIVPPSLSPSDGITFIMGHLFISYRSLPRGDRKGLLEYVVTRGGGSESRPSQK